jgi:hypothetical protein
MNLCSRQSVKNSTTIIIIIIIIIIIFYYYYYALNWIIGKVSSLEYNDIPKVILTPHHVRLLIVAPVVTTEVRRVKRDEAVDKH